MSAPQFVLRSLRPEVTGPAVEAANKARAEAASRALAWTEARWPWLVPMQWAQFDGSFSIAGFVSAEGLTHAEPVPDGMRYDPKARHIVPAKRTDEGKALVPLIRALAFTYPRIDGLGGIVHGYADGPEVESHLRRGYFTGWSFHVLGGAVFATLPVPYPDKRDVDAGGDRWTPAKLSEFYAAKEAAA